MAPPRVVSLSDPHPTALVEITLEIARLQPLEQLVQGWRAVLLVFSNMGEEKRDAGPCLKLLSVGHKVLRWVQQANQLRKHRVRRCRVVVVDLQKRVVEFADAAEDRGE